MFTYMKMEVKVTQEQATNTQRGSSDVAVLFI
jgi:hypothetical protein